MLNNKHFVVSVLKANHIGLATGDFKYPRCSRTKVCDKVVLINSILLDKGKEKLAKQWILEAISRKSAGRFMIVDTITASVLGDSTGDKYHYNFKVTLIDRKTKRLSYPTLRLNEIKENLPPVPTSITQGWKKECRQANTNWINRIHTSTQATFKKGYADIISYPLFLLVSGFSDQEISKLLKHKP